MRENFEYNSIDICKLIMSIFVVAIHTQPLAECNNQQILAFNQVLVSLAVPFFFLSFGFFIGKKMEVSKEEQYDLIIQSSLKKTIKQYCIWSIVYLPLAIVFYYKKGYSFLFSVFFYFKDFFLVGEHYNSWILWFLLSAIYCLVLVRILIKNKCSWRKILSICLVLWVIGIGIDVFVGQTDLEGGIDYFRKLICYSIGSGRLLIGFGYIPLGMYMGLFTNSFRKNYSYVVLFFIGFIVSMFLSYNTDIFGVFLYRCLSWGCATCFFIIAKNVRAFVNRDFCILRKTSTVIYFTHLMIWTLVYSILYKEPTYGFCVFALTTIISGSIGVLYYYFCFKKKKKKRI